MKDRLAIGDRVRSAPEYRGAPRNENHLGTVVGHNTDRTVIVTWDGSPNKKRTILEERLERVHE